MTDPVLSRRRFVRDASLFGGSVWLAAQLPWPRAARAAADSSASSVLAPPEWKTLEAITARILPTDHEPGAREAGCTNFIDKALANEESAARPLYQAGLRGVDAAARARFERPFIELGEIEQDELLAALETGNAQGWPDDAGPSPSFFETVRVHTLIAFLAHPKYGGNRDYGGWRVTRYPGPRHHEGGYTPEQMTGAAKVKTVWGGEQ